ncbi:Tumor necrosis factor alpha-induced protein like [Heracleum sosnowskyi]|uniref:Tumor necrosis factor alpha-induced protein like n=1 Tax=Heracleum sosnowskyi TaxID=360622 RepID=A0AAD8HZ10_9APIA|nr:Tumor necrosis factor alpha-induced protein like [Heracleum sosnowskyi]
MKTRGTKKSAAPDFELSAAVASPDPSLTDSPPIKFSFNLNTFNIPNTSAAKATSSSKKTNRNDVNNKISTAAAVASVPNGASSPMNNPSSIADLKALASSQLEAVKRQFERSHSDFVKDAQAFHSRLHKRLKIQTQGCQQAMDEAEKEFKKINGQISESQEAMKASYMEFIAEAQASASRVCKTSIPELTQSLENLIGVFWTNGRREQQLHISPAAVMVQFFYFFVLLCIDVALNSETVTIEISLS